jgi:hypothetical protein
VLTCREERANTPNRAASKLICFILPADNAPLGQETPIRTIDYQYRGCYCTGHQHIGDWLKCRSGADLLADERSQAGGWFLKKGVMPHCAPEHRGVSIPTSFSVCLSSCTPVLPPLRLWGLPTSYEPVRPGLPPDLEQ